MSAGEHRKDVAHPPTDMRVRIAEDGAWRVECPPRMRLRHAAHALAGIVAGGVLGVTSAAGLFEGMMHPSWGARVFLLGWLGPLGVIALLLLWLGAKTFARVWQSDVLESDGQRVRHLRVGPWKTHTLFEIPLDRLEPFQPPTEREFPVLADQNVRRAYRGPLVVRYRPRQGEGVLDYRCIGGVRYDELHWLASALNPQLKKEREP